MTQNTTINIPDDELNLEIASATDLSATRRMFSGANETEIICRRILIPKLERPDNSSTRS